MVDTVVNLQFNNNPLYDAGGNAVGSCSANVNVDYTNRTITGGVSVSLSRWRNE